MRSTHYQHSPLPWTRHSTSKHRFSRIAEDRRHLLALEGAEIGDHPSLQNVGEIRRNFWAPREEQTLQSKHKETPLGFLSTRRTEQDTLISLNSDNTPHTPALTPTHITHLSLRALSATIQFHTTPTLSPVDELRSKLQEHATSSVRRRHGS